MKNKSCGIKKWLVYLLCLCVLFPSTIAYADVAENNNANDITISKQATELKNDISDITLTVGQTTTNYDVVFVIDNNIWPDAKQEIIDRINNMIEALQEAPSAEIKVGAVKYQETIHTTDFPLTSLRSFDWNAWDTFIDAKADPGCWNTATNAGLISANKMLSSDNTVPAENKFLIFINNDLTHAWVDSDGKTYGISYTNSTMENANSAKDTTTAWAWAAKYGSDGDDMSYDPATSTGGWSAIFTNTADKIGVVRETYASEIVNSSLHGGEQIDYGSEDGKNLPTTNEVGYYLCYQEWQNMKEKGYQLYAAQDNLNNAYPFNTSFLALLNNGVSESLDSICSRVERKLIGTVVDKGSYVTDYIGSSSATDGTGYNFDFVNNASALTMKVGSTSLLAEKITDNQYGFDKKGDGTYNYVLTYYPTSSEGEHFVWQFNVPVKSLLPIQLIYKVALDQKPTAVGSYILNTNNSATLIPVNTDSEQLDGVAFDKPTVTYTVTTPPAADTTEPTESNPDTDATTSPQTGDNSLMALWIALLFVSGSLMTVTGVYGKKKRSAK